jgi:hypothetical protein
MGEVFARDFELGLYPTVFKGKWQGGSNSTSARNQGKKSDPK